MKGAKDGLEQQVEEKQSMMCSCVLDTKKVVEILAR